MSTLYVDKHIEVVKLTMQPKIGGSSVSYSFAFDYFASGLLYTTNAVIYPLLVSSPKVRRGVGTYYGIKYDVSIELYAKTDMDGRGRTLARLLEAYELHDADVEVRYYPKPDSGITTDADASNLRQKLKVIASDINEQTGNITLQCRDVFFKDKEVSKKLTSEAFSGIDARYEGEYGPIIFGQNTTTADGVPFDSNIVSVLTASPWRFVHYFSGWTFTGIDNKAFRRILARNDQNQAVDPTDWVQVELPIYPDQPFLGNATLSGATESSLAAQSRAIQYTPVGNADLLCAARIAIGWIGTAPVGEDGTLKFLVYHAQYKGTSDTWEPVGSPLATVTKDPEIVSAGTEGSEVLFVLDTPLVLSPFANYMMVIEWTNKTDTANTYSAYYKAVVGETHYQKLHNETDRGWEKQSGVQLAMELYSIGYAYAWEPGDNTYSYLYLEGITESGNSADLERGLEIKLGIDGLSDDGSGTYTGSANALIQNPADIAYFTLKNSEFGVGLASGAIDATAFSTARSYLSNTGINHKIVINQYTTAEDLITEVARQSKSIIYKDRRGRMSMQYPLYHNNVATVFSEEYHRGDLFLVEVTDNDYSQVVNDFENFYSPDEFNQPKDIAKLRRAERLKYQGALVLNDTTSTSGDTARQAKCSASVTRYGRREYTQRFPFFDSATYAQILQNYYCDRYSTLQRKVKVKIPRKTYYTSLDLFSNIQVQHSAIESTAGSDLNALGFNSTNNDVACYTSGNIPVQNWIGGTITGQVVEVEEDGYWLILTAETQSIF